MANKNEYINPFDLVPKYGQLANIVRQKIEDGEWGGDKPIPSERELENIYKVSRTTVREALGMLVNRGYLYRDHGRGTFAVPKKLQNSLQNLTSFTDDMKLRGLKPGQKILRNEFIEPNAKIRHQLDLPDEVNEVLYIERLRLADDEPIGLHLCYLPLSSTQAITNEDLENAGSLYELLERKYNLIPAEADETIEATTADEKEAELLGITPGQPLLLVKRTLWSQHRKVMEFVKVLYRADRYQYFVHLTR
jgi:GntR family transcriptional regulator